MNRWRVRIEQDLAETVLAQARHWAPLETGGLLLGHRDETARVIRVAELVDAGPGAVRESNRFTPDGAWQKHQIAISYERSGRTLAYLGDWHSHPRAGGPSELDRTTARRISRAPNARCEQPVMLIAVCKQESWELHAYRWRRRRLGRIKVSVEGGPGRSACRARD